MRRIQADKSKNTMSLLQQSSDITQGDFAWAEVLCVCTMITDTKMRAIPDSMTSALGSRAQEQSYFLPEALLVLQMQPWLPSHQPLLLPHTCSWNIKDTLTWKWQEFTPDHVPVCIPQTSSITAKRER